MKIESNESAYQLTGNSRTEHGSYSAGNPNKSPTQSDGCSGSDTTVGAKGRSTKDNVASRTKPNAKYLIARGDRLSIEQGQLVIRAASKKPVSQDWLDAHKSGLLHEILLAMHMDAYVYHYYTTGKYVKGKGGVTLQFSSIVRGARAYVIFNAEVTRSRNVGDAKAGQKLPKKHFRVKPGSEFIRFWLATGLRQPKRLSSFHDYMGKLKTLLFTAPVQDERMDARKLQPLSISSEAIRGALLPDNRQTVSGQAPDKNQTSQPDKHLVTAQQSRAIQPDSPAGPNYHGNKVTSICGYRTARTTPSPTNDPKEQTVDDWLDEYSSADDDLRSASYPVSERH